MLLISKIEEDEGESEEEDGPSGGAPPLSDKERNSQLTVGYKGDRSYVIRGNKIGVFSHTDEDVKYHATIGNIATPKGKIFEPSRVRLPLYLTLTEMLMGIGCL